MYLFKELFRSLLLSDFLILNNNKNKEYKIVHSLYIYTSAHLEKLQLEEKRNLKIIINFKNKFSV